MKLALVLGGLLFVSVSINMVMFAKLDTAKIELQTAINNQAVLERTVQEQNDQIVKALESATKEVGVDLLMGKNTAQFTKFKLNLITTINVKGKADALDVYTV